MPSKHFDWSKVGGTPIASGEFPGHFDWSQFGAVEASLPSRSMGKSALRQIGRLGRAGATGISSLADIPNLAALGLHAAGVREEPTFYKPVAGRVQEGIDELTGGRLKPENKAEEYVDIIGEGLAPMALAPLTGGASLTGVAARGLAKQGTAGFAKKAAEKVTKMGSNPYKITASNVAGSAGSSAALKAYIDEYQDPNLASMAGGAGGRGLAKLRNPANALAEGVGKATGFSPEKYAKNVELGLPVTPATVSKSSLPKYVEMVAAKMPGSMGPLEDFYKKREAAVAGNLGIRTPEDLEHTVRNVPKHLAKIGAKGYHERTSKIFKHREDKFKPRETEAISNQELVDVSNIIKKLEHERSLSLTLAAQKRFDRTKDGVLLKELKESIPTSTDSSIPEALKKQGYSKELIERIINAENGSGKKGIGLHDLNKLREKALSESIELKTPRGGGTPESRSAAERSQMLANKRHQFMEEIGTPIEAHNAKQARKFWAQYKNKENGMAKYVAKLTGSEDDATAFKKLTGSNPKYINIARQGLKKSDRPKLGEAIIADLGARQGRFNLNTAYTGFANLEEPVKKEFLKTLPNKASQNNFEGAMKFIGENKKMMESLANTSGTAHSKHIIDLMQRYGAAAGLAATGVSVMPLAGLAATYGGLKVGAKLWTNQNFLKRMNDTITAKTAKSQTNHLDLLLKSVNQVGRQTKHTEEAHKNK